MQNIYRLASACINIDHGAFRHCIHQLALRADLAPILFLEAASFDESPMTVRTTDDALGLKHVLQESAETSRAFAVAACGLVTTGSREVRDSDVGVANLFQTRSRIAQALRTRPEAGQAAKFFVVAGHLLMHVQELWSCTSEILLKTLRDVSCVPKETCEHALKRENCHQRQTGCQHGSSEGVVPRARARLVASSSEM